MTKFMIGSTAAFVALTIAGCARLPESPDSDEENVGIDSYGTMRTWLRFVNGY